MKRSISFPIFLLGFLLFVWTSLPRIASDQVRSFTVAACLPAWRCAAGVREYLSDRPILKNKRSDPIEISQLKLENYLLHSQLELAKEWIFFEKGMQSLGNSAKTFEYQSVYLSDLFERQSRALPAQVIYRDPSSWSSSLWINIGEEDNRKIGSPVVARNSPVMDGNALAGVIDYVGKHQSRVRLITDSGLTPSVRVVRGASSNREIAYLVDALAKRLETRSSCLEEFLRLKEKLGNESKDLYLAKGELHGIGAPFWQSRLLLKGVGFNYDYPDPEGPARELRTGRPLIGSGTSLPLIQEGDHLVTSGLDGVFPAGLSVAIVKSVFPLKEGSFAYEIEAFPTAPFLKDLRIVFVLPALSGE